MASQHAATLFDEPDALTVLKQSTPLMRQYYGVKEKHPNTILLFRMGDFYETFDSDARLVAPILGLTLTKRANGKAASVALAGFPHHSLDSYLPKLIRAGHRVAICEQVEDASATKSIVRREVQEVVTPGVSFRDELLSPSRSNYLAALVGDATADVGIAFLDVSTGEFTVTEVAQSEVDRVLDGIHPTEILIPESNASRFDRLRNRGCMITPVPDWTFGHEFATSALTDHFETHSLKGFGLDELTTATRAAGAVLQYVKDTQNGRMPPIRTMARYRTDSFMLLDAPTRRNLDLDTGASNGSASLVSILDETQTPMGARRLRSWILKPLVDSASIQKRLDAVTALMQKSVRRSIRGILADVGDIERLVVKNATGRSSPRDLVNLAASLSAIEPLPGQLEPLGIDLFADLLGSLVPSAPVIQAISSAISDEPPASVNSGGVIRPGYSTELDELRGLATSGKDLIAQIQKEESERTGISSLKVGYNRVFGYYLEVTNTHKDKVPDYFIRKQTLVNAERYITPRLKELEEKILHAQERIDTLESELFEQVRSSVNEHADTMLVTAEAVAVVDSICAFATAADLHRYVRPTVNDSRKLHIEDGRHPVVESTLEPGNQFIPNTVAIDPDSEQILVVTGPNMAGKSVVLRQTGLIVLMAQIGSFVPAAKAEIGVVDRIFTRVGASDNLLAGESTFLVEMNEAANILNSATPRSLILLDEVGRGTSTFDGLSIAWAIVEYLHETDSVAAKTMFATHYHELNELASRLDRVVNYRVLVQEHSGKVVFLRKLVRGGADHSYGIEVAKMAGLPDVVLARAREVLNHLEHVSIVVDEPSAGKVSSGDGASVRPSAPKPSAHLAEVAQYTGHHGTTDVNADLSSEIVEKIKALDINRLSPIEALVLLNELSTRLADSK